jgi:hypothetical protein
LRLFSSLLCVAIIGMTASIHARPARTWHVKADGTGDLPTLQAAIDSAAAGDTVLAAPGIYSWSNQGSGDEYALVRFIRGKTGFWFRSEAGPDYTTLDAERGGRVIYIQGGDNNQVTVEGFTIIGGRAPLFGDYCGGGLLAHLSSPIFRDCVFRDNTADRGGAVYYAGVSGPRFESCVFSGNRAAIYGGGIFLVNSSLVPVFIDCIIRFNTAGTKGGGIFSYHFPMSLIDCAIYANAAGEKGGGIYSERGYPATVHGCTIAENSSPDGSAIHLFMCEPMTVTSSILALNHDGPPLSVNQSTLRIGCCDVFGNAGGDDLPQGAVDLGDMLFLDPGFCGVPGSRNYYLRSDSPCLQENQGDEMFCGLIGAFPRRCGAVSTRDETWGGIKARFLR